MKSFTFGADGWRARYSDSFDQESVALLASAFAQCLLDRVDEESAGNAVRPGRTPVLCIGFDTRPEADRYALIAAQAAAAEGLASSQGQSGGRGLRVRLSQAPCTLAELCWNTAADDDAVGALMVTAGHNDASWNGIKMRLGDGGTVTPEFQAALQAAVGAARDDGGVPATQDASAAGADGGMSRVLSAASTEGTEDAGGAEGSQGAVSAGSAGDAGVTAGADRVVVGADSIERFDFSHDYLERLVALVDSDAIRAAGMSVAHDSMYGPTRTLFPQLMDQLGVACTPVHGEEADDFGGMQPLPVEALAGDLRRAVVDSGAWAGFMNGSEGTRVSAVDNRGRYVSSDKLAALVLELLCERRSQSGSLVVTAPTSVVVRMEAARLGCPVIETAVGYRSIYEQVVHDDVLLAVQEDGGVLLPHHMRERDGVLVALYVCELMALTGRKLSELVDDLESRTRHMEYGRREIELDAGTYQMARNMLPGINPTQVAGMEPTEVGHGDGLRLLFEDGSWAIVRAATTESVVRIYAEAPTAEQLQELLDDLYRYLRKQLML